MDRIFPFEPKDKPKKGLIQNINFQYSTRAENRIVTTEDDLFTSRMFENAKSGIQHTLPLSTNFKILKYFNMAASANYLEVWQPKTIKYNDYDPSLGVAVKDTISGLKAFRTYSYGLSLATNVYGTINFKEDKKYDLFATLFDHQLAIVQHLVLINIMMNILLMHGNTREYTQFEGVLFGQPLKRNLKKYGNKYK